MTSPAPPWHLGRRPALDGLRGLAVLLVLINHFETPFTQSGTVGVTIFFTLSGFLITCLLLEERERSGRLDLARFYLRRARRLVPALLVAVGLSCFVQLITFGEVTDWALVVTTLTWTSNFEMMDLDFPWPSGLAHTWSLALEEQFYLVWPLVLILMRRWSRRRTVAALMLVAYGSLLVRAVAWDGTEAGWARGYFAPDARADSLVAGCILALVVRADGRAGAPSAWFAPMGLLSIVMWGLWHTQGDITSARQVVLPSMVALATCLILYAAAADRPIRILETRGLRRIGVISYGLYLFHGPVLLLVTQHVGSGPVYLWTIACPLTFALAAASWRWIEAPILGRRPAVARADSSLGSSRRGDQPRYLDPPESAAADPVTDAR